MIATGPEFRNVRFRIGSIIAVPAINRLRDEGGGERHLEPKVMDLLVALAERPGEALGRSELIDRVWGLEYGGDESLSRAVSIMRKAFAALDPHTTYVETVAKRGYRLIAPVSAVTDDPVQIPEASGGAAARRRGGAAAIASRSGGAMQGFLRARIMISAAVLITVGAAILLLVWRSTPAPSLDSETSHATAPASDRLSAAPVDDAQPDGIKIAVLPFVPLSSDNEDGYFADGLTEEISNSLAAIPAFNVTARTSSFYFKGKDLRAPEIAALLGVEHIVEGSGRRSDEELRITAQLVCASDGFRLWSKTYTFSYNDVFDVQYDVAENIARTLDIVLDQNDRRLMRLYSVDDIEAFIAYQKGYSLISTGQPEDMIAANAEFDKATALEPNFSAAHHLKGFRWYHTMTRPELFPASDVKAAPAAMQATLAAAQSNLREQRFRTPHFIALLTLGRFEEAERISRQFASPVTRNMLESTLRAARGDSQALAGFDEFLNELSDASPTDDMAWRHPTQSNVAMWRLVAHARAGDRAGANAIATEIDSENIASSLTLMELLYNCVCGAPFDLEAAPHFKKRFEESGLSWPPASPVDWPLKDW